MTAHLDSTLRLVAASSLAGLLACGPAAEAPPGTAGPGPISSAPSEPIDFSGSYRVRGKTVEKETGNARELRGTIILAQDGDRYTSTFDLTTDLPTPEGSAVKTQVVGTGEGTVEGGALRGTARTQLLWAAVPGVDSHFAFVPRRYGPRLSSTSLAWLDAQGKLEIEIESQGEPGESYRPTHTTLQGTRVESER